MNLTPMVTQALEHFRLTQKLPQGSPLPIDAELAERTLDNVRDHFEQARRQDNQSGDLDLRSGVVVRSVPAETTLTQVEGDFEQGRVESHTLLRGQGQYSEIALAGADRLDALESLWNEKEAIFLVYHIDRRHAEQSTLTAWKLGECS